MGGQNCPPPRLLLIPAAQINQGKYIMYSKNLLRKINDMQFIFQFSMSFVVSPISQKNTSKYQLSISRSKDRWKSYICTPGWAQAHMMTNTKQELRNLFLCRKTISETIKSFSICDLQKYLLLYLFSNYIMKFSKS